jgi:hypothetical protein
MKLVKKEISFAAEFSKLFNTAIRQREFLLRTQRNQRRESEVRQAMDHLMPYHQMNFSNDAAARFIVKHETDIVLIIPANQSGTIEKFYGLYRKAKELTK